jgi:hypothetical protein
VAKSPFIKGTIVFMHSRAVVVAILALLLFTGIASSTACEMMCLSAYEVTACCAHTTAHCTSTDAVMHVHQCSHPQEGTALAATVPQTLQLHATHIGSAVTPSPYLVLAVNFGDAPLRDSLKRSSFTPPLRI